MINRNGFERARREISRSWKRIQIKIERAEFFQPTTVISRLFAVFFLSYTAYDIVETNYTARVTFTALIHDPTLVASRLIPDEQLNDGSVGVQKKNRRLGNVR